MPRTKAVRKKAPQGLSATVLNYVEEIEALKTRRIQEVTTAWNVFITQQKAAMVKAKLSIPPKLTNVTLGELKKMGADWTGNATNASIYPVNMTKCSNKSLRNNHHRSSSVGTTDIDEGYRTGESNGPLGSSHESRKSRANVRVSKSSRKSRSVPVRSEKTRNNFFTPAQKIPKNSFGTITPKMNPNTPQVLLRRPRQGELAVSMQGSPLMTGGTMGDGTANINIPLEDGRLLSLQPQRGLRISQIPQLDLETKKQLELLRDNLNKVCLANK